MSRPIDHRGRLLKDRTRTLQSSIHGVREAGKVTGKGHTQHGRFQEPNAPDFATIDDIVRMESVAPRDANWPPVTSLMCELAGGVFIPLPDGEVHEDPLALGIVALAKEFGELAAAIQEGLADGTLAPEELLRARREGSDLQQQLASFLRTVDVMLEENPPSVTAIRLAGNT